MNRDRVHLLHIQRNIAHVQRLAGNDKSAFLADEDKQAAILYYLQTRSESTTRLSETLKDAQPHIAWQQIKGLRNRVVHDYLNVDLELVWLIIQKEVAALAPAIDAMLASLPDESEA